MEKLSFRLEVFEGPLDVLLYLIAKHKLNIYDIPIAELLSQYLTYLGVMREMDLDVTSEFLEMASRLVQIKSSMLLPKYEGEDGEDPRSELMATLIEYQTCKQMAKSLAARAGGFDCFTREPITLEQDLTYRRRHLPVELYEAYLSAAGKAKRRLPPTISAFRGIVGRKIVTVASRVVHIVRRLISEGKKDWNELFEDATGRSEAVATFLAVLELVKSKKIIVEQEGRDQTVRAVRRVGRRLRVK